MIVHWCWANSDRWLALLRYFYHQSNSNELYISPFIYVCPITDKSLFLSFFLSFSPLLYNFLLRGSFRRLNGLIYFPLIVRSGILVKCIIKLFCCNVKWAIPCLFSLFLNFLSNKIKFAYDWIWTAALWCWEWPLLQLSHNYPALLFLTFCAGS